MCKGNQFQAHNEANPSFFGFFILFSVDEGSTLSYRYGNHTLLG